MKKLFVDLESGKVKPETGFIFPKGRFSSVRFRVLGPGTAWFAVLQGGNAYDSHAVTTECSEAPERSCDRVSVTVSMGFGEAHIEAEQLPGSMSCEEKLMRVFQSMATEHQGAFFAGSTLGSSSLETATGDISFKDATGGDLLVQMGPGGGVEVSVTADLQ